MVEAQPQHYTHALHVTQVTNDQETADKRIEKVVEELVMRGFAVTVSMIEPEILTEMPAGMLPPSDPPDS